MHICDQFNSIKIATLQKAELMSDARTSYVQHSSSSNCSILFEQLLNQSPVIYDCWRDNKWTVYFHESLHACSYDQSAVSILCISVQP
jgi:hypothetical protein